MNHNRAAEIPGAVNSSVTSTDTYTETQVLFAFSNTLYYNYIGRNLVSLKTVSSTLLIIYTPLKETPVAPLLGVFFLLLVMEKFALLKNKMDTKKPGILF
ncbi:hypothetical protein C0033_07995 [Clostridium sp. chh4-2]|uniref:hypothetical protein n=1 Tax=Clostridium sp. chh4-2 TaxID=2067550 RepID=UPI000CCDC2A1|nr:hypothetical protein [Clostridium sp. chh4-2]PNV62495.1 hypothetical protein C0033_07995 [Clostridium sp. chh4-2]